MERPKRNFPAVALLILLAPLVASAQAKHPGPRAATLPTARNSYVGDTACQSCHAAETTLYQTNSHHLASRPADAHSIAGSFTPGSNLFTTSNPALTFKMTSGPDGFHQTAVDQIAPGKSIEQSQRFDIVVGAAIKSQTYLYWKAGELFELPVSYWTRTGQWINSPGYQDGNIRFDRIIVPRCLECHASSFESLPPPANKYAPASLVLGITCEKCHGPGAQHVALYTANPTLKSGTAKAIVNPATLPRNRQIDTCALCHAGLGEPLAPALSYQPGDTLEKYIHFPALDPNLPIDVHGNQVQLLRRSRCFQASNMTCQSCHKLHQPEPATAAAYSPYCIECHQPKQCGRFAAMGEAITRNCVDCHMPLKKSEALFSNSNDQTLQLPVRDHRIAIYPAN